jgi:hypothetical protein
MTSVQVNRKWLGFGRNDVNDHGGSRSAGISRSAWSDLAGLSLCHILANWKCADNIWSAWHGEAPLSSKIRKESENDSLPSSETKSFEHSFLGPILRYVLCRAGGCGRQAARRSGSALVAYDQLEDYSDG